MITIYVLAAGDLFQHVLNAMAAFTALDSFVGLLKLSALIGIVMATTGFLKSHDPMVFARWFLGFLLFTHCVLIPKTSVMIMDVSSQKPKLVDNVPVVFAISASLITSIGFGLAQVYDMLLALPDDLQYTKTGSLFASRLIQASTSFRIMDPVLKEEMNEYFRACVVGDIRLNNKYSVGELAHSTNIWNLISAKASPLRMVNVNGKLVSCLEASKPSGVYSLKKKLDAEINKAYKYFGINLFGKPKHTSYEQLFSTHLTSAFNYYQALTDSASNIFLQSMMINAMEDGVSHYQAFTDATAGVVNQQFTKSQVQHRWSWLVLGQKALWILPITHTCLTILLFGVFPLIMVLATVPGGHKLLYGYFQFFLSLQFWPVLFAILNAGMTLYGASSSSEYGPFTMVNLDKIDELHRDVSGACGYLMMLIPFLSHGLVSNLGSAFSNLATSMMSHMQGSSMSAAGEAASASFGLGQTSFYNTTANTLSRNNVSENNVHSNKHDTNWTNLHGMHTEQLASGVLKTKTPSGDTIFDVGPGMTRGALSINTSEGLNASLNQAYEESQQAAKNESSHYQRSLSNFAHRALQLSQLKGHDMRFGDSVSAQDSSNLSQALSTIRHTAEDVASKTGMSREDALSHLTQGGFGVQAGIKSNRSMFGKLVQWSTGASIGADAHLKFDRTSSGSDRYQESADSVISTRKAKDFNDALNVVHQFSKNHHFDDTQSQGAQLLNQMGADLREAETASRNYDASLSRAERIQNTKSYVATESAHINMDLNQAFPGYVAKRLSPQHRDELFSQPGNIQALNQLQGLGQEFIAEKREELIAKIGNHSSQIESFYHDAQSQVAAKGAHISKNYQNENTSIKSQEVVRAIGVDEAVAEKFKHNASQQMNRTSHKLQHNKQLINEDRNDLIERIEDKIDDGMDNAQKNAVLLEDFPRTGLELHNKGE